jgi:uncharacterized protein
MLAFLFGYSFSVLMQKVKVTQKHPYLFFSWRMALLSLRAIFNSAIYYGDILKDYAMLGMVILCISKFGEKVYLRLALVCFILLPALIPWSQHLGLHSRDCCYGVRLAGVLQPLVAKLFSIRTR